MVKRLALIDHQYVLLAAALTATDETVGTELEGLMTEEKEMAVLEQIDFAAVFLFDPAYQFSLAMMEPTDHLTL